MDKASKRPTAPWPAQSGTGEFDSVAARPTQIVFIDGSIGDAQTLAAGVSAGVVAVILDPDQDGVGQIADYLASHDIHGAAAIDIVAHGADGVVQLGSTVLSADTIAQHLPQLAQIGEALKPGGDILLYGCDVAQDATGEAFLQQLSQATGGANIAASSHVIGAAAAGGDWNLDIDTGTIDVAAPFTQQALAAFADVLPVATNQLFASFNHSTGNSLTRLEQFGVSGTSVVGTPVDIRDGTLTSNFSFLQGVAVDAPLGKYFMVNSDNSTVNQIVVGSVTGGAPTVLYSAPDIADYEFAGMAIDQPNHTIYFAQASSNPAQDGIYKIDESGGTATAVVVNQGIVSPLNLSLDLGDGLVFFVDNQGISSGVNRLDVGNLSTGIRTVLNTQLNATVQSQLATSAAQLTGVAVDAPNNVLYFTAENGTRTTNNFIYKVPYTVSAGSVTLGTVTTLYAGTAAGHPGNIVLDTVGGRFYVGDLTTQAIDTGSLTGGGSVSQVFQLTGTVGVQPNGLFFLSTPTVAASGSVTYAQGGSAVVLNSGLTTVNPDGQNLASATVAITGGTFIGDGDTLVANTTGTAITTTGYNAATETLTLSGNDTLAHYQAVLRSITYSSSASDPSNTGAKSARTLSWTINDGIISSTTPTTTVGIHAAFITAGATVTFNGGGAPVALDSVLTAGDTSGTNFTGATVTIGNFVSGDTLTVGAPGGLTPGFSNGTLTLSGTADFATYQTALRSVEYGFTSGGDPTAGGSKTSRSISWQVNDGTVTSPSANSSLNTVHVAPTITASGTVTYTKGGSSLPLDSTLTITSPDSGGNLVNAVVVIGGFISGDTLTVGTPGGLTTSFNATGTLTLSGTASVATYQTALDSVGYSFNPSTGDPTGGGSHTTRTISWTANDGVASSTAATSTLNTQVACYCRGTRILTPTGEIPIEALAIGDLVVTASSATKPIKWIGRRSYAGRFIAGNRALLPVLIRQDALDDGVPRRDLYISPKHALLLDDVLVPAERLVNGVSIVRCDTVATVEYVHIELDTHDIILAEGAPSETFTDCNNRLMFQNADEFARLYPDSDAPTWAFCAPRVEEGDVLQQLRCRLDERLEAFGCTTTFDPDLHLMVDGMPVLADRVDDTVHVFRLDCPAREVRIVSRSSVPAALDVASADIRRLGVNVSRVVLSSGDVNIVVGCRDTSLVDGFHASEGTHRWTDGDARVPAKFLACFDKDVTIEVHVQNHELSYRIGQWGAEQFAEKSA